METKTEAVNAYLVKNSKVGVEGRGQQQKVTLTSSRKDWAELRETDKQTEYHPLSSTVRKEIEIICA